MADEPHLRQSVIPDNDWKYNRLDIPVIVSVSLLMVAMGEQIPKSLWSVNDYSVLYGILDDNKDELDLRGDD